jgi:CRISPR type III-A-associated protein Csm2
MAWDRKKLIPSAEIQEKVTQESVRFAEDFGKELAKAEYDAEPLTTSQLRKFFGEVKRQQMMTEFNETEFIMLKPKLAYAVGRAKQNGRKGKKQKIEDFYWVMADAIDKVMDSADKEKAFKNFITIFEAIVAYHKAAEKQ